MSRSGYSDEIWDYGLGNLYRGTVNRAINGKRGQAFLRDMLTYLDAMPVKALAAHEWVKGDQACALGVAAKARGLGDEFEKYDPDDDHTPVLAAQKLGIAEALAREMVWVNDEATYGYQENPWQRWKRVRDWVAGKVQDASGAVV